MIEEPARRVTVLDLILNNKDRLVGNVKLKGSLDCSDHEKVELKILAGPLIWILGEQTSDSSGIYLVEYHGIKPLRAEGPKKTG